MHGEGIADNIGASCQATRGWTGAKMEAPINGNGHVIATRSSGAFAAVLVQVDLSPVDTVERRPTRPRRIPPTRPNKPHPFSLRWSLLVPLLSLCDFGHQLLGKQAGYQNPLPTRLFAATLRSLPPLQNQSHLSRTCATSSKSSMTAS